VFIILQKSIVIGRRSTELFVRHEYLKQTLSKLVITVLDWAVSWRLANLCPR